MLIRRIIAFSHDWLTAGLWVAGSCPAELPFVDAGIHLTYQFSPNCVGIWADDLLQSLRLSILLFSVDEWFCWSTVGGTIGAPALREVITARLSRPLSSHCIFWLCYKDHAAALLWMACISVLEDSWVSIICESLSKGLWVHKIRALGKCCQSVELSLALRSICSASHIHVTGIHYASKQPKNQANHILS